MNPLIIAFVSLTLSSTVKCQHTFIREAKILPIPKLFDFTVGQDESIIDSLTNHKICTFTTEVGIDETSVGDSSKIYTCAQVSLSYSKPSGGGNWRLLGLTTNCDSCFSTMDGKAFVMGSSVQIMREEHPELFLDVAKDILNDSLRLSRMGSLSNSFNRDIDHVSVFDYGLMHLYFREGRANRVSIQHQLE